MMASPSLIFVGSFDVTSGVVNHCFALVGHQTKAKKLGGVGVGGGGEGQEKERKKGKGERETTEGVVVCSGRQRDKKKENGGCCCFFSILLKATTFGANPTTHPSFFLPPTPPLSYPFLFLSHTSTFPIF